MVPLNLPPSVNEVCIFLLAELIFTGLARKIAPAEFILTGSACKVTGSVYFDWVSILNLCASQIDFDWVGM